MMLDCCDECIHYHTCVKKWILGQRGVNASCCIECREFEVCMEKNREIRWRMIHGYSKDSQN